MSEMLDHHTRAMDLVAQATRVAPMEPVEESHRRALFEQALESGMKAIAELENLEYHDLTYSVIHRSIAATALDCGKYELAQQLAAKPLARNPHPAIVPELLEVMHRANFQLRLRQQGLTLAPDEVEMILDGPAVGNDGTIPWTDWRSRITTVIDFFNAIVKDSAFKPPIYISPPHASSFAVKIKLGSPIASSVAFDGFDPIPVYVDKFMNYMSAVNQLDLRYLKTQFNDQTERQSFLETARSIAPDGERVAHVNFIQTRPNSENRTVEITTTVSALPKPADIKEPDVPKEEEPTEVEFIGRLLVADGRVESNDQITIVHGNTEQPIRIPEDESIYDIIREMWNRQVQAIATRSKDEFVLKQIKLLEFNVQSDMFEE